MICVHLLKLECFTADRTFMSLLFIRSQCITAVKGTNGQFLFLTRQQILIDTGFLCNIFITHKALNFNFQLLRIKICSLAMCVV